MNVHVRPFLPYGRQVIEEDDVAAVAEALHGDLLTTGPYVERFEKKLAETVGARFAAACSNGTTALYMAARALDLGPGNAVVVPAITFLATASAPHLAGASIVFADIDPETGLMGARDLEEALARAPGGSADAVFNVHFAGQCGEIFEIAALARDRGMKIVEDAAHALGAASTTPSGSVATVGANVTSDLTTFSFHPVKTIAMGEGGAVTANDPELAAKLKRLRNHGTVREPGDFVHTDAAFDVQGVPNPWYYELFEPSFNFRLPDINCALGLSQLGKLGRFVARRRALALAYDAALAPLAPLVKPLARHAHALAAWHIYVVRLDFESAGIGRAALMRALHAQGIGTQVHYIPVHRQPYFARVFPTPRLPGAESYYARTLTLPLHAGMTLDDVNRVVDALTGLLRIR